jgi:hypothetical protein
MCLKLSDFWNYFAISAFVPWEWTQLRFMNSQASTLTQNDSFAAALGSHWASNGGLGLTASTVKNLS